MPEKPEPKPFGSPFPEKEERPKGPAKKVEPAPADVPLEEILNPKTTVFIEEEKKKGTFV